MTQTVVRIDDDVVALSTSSDHTLIEAWLYERPEGTTKRNYRRVAERFLAEVGKPIGGITLVDLQDWASGLTLLKASSRLQYVKTIKSLLSFAASTRYTTFNVGAAMRMRDIPDKRSERILTEEEVRDMLHAADARSDRDYALILVLYTTALRAAEAASLTWADIRPQGKTGVVDVLGKGSRRRTVLMPEVTWHVLQALRPRDVAVTLPVFRGLRGDSITPKGIWHVVRRAATDAGIDRNVSPHWLRHACASHALDHGAPVHVVQATLGHQSLATTSAYVHARPDNAAGLYLEV